MEWFKSLRKGLGGNSSSSSETLNAEREDLTSALRRNMSWSDTPEEKQLESIWSSYEQPHPSEEPQDQEKTFSEFLKLFNHTYARSYPKDEETLSPTAPTSNNIGVVTVRAVHVGFSYGLDSVLALAGHARANRDGQDFTTVADSRHDETIVLTPAGHPTRVILGMGYMLKKIVPSIAIDIDLKDADETIDAELCLDLLDGFRILSRFRHNRRIMKHNEFFPYLLRLTDTLIKKLPSIESFMSQQPPNLSHPHRRAEYPLGLFVEEALGACVEVLSNFVSGRVAWKLPAVRRESLVFVDHDEGDNPLMRDRSPSTTGVSIDMDREMIKVIIAVLRAIRECVGDKPRDSQVVIQMMLLDALGALTFQNLEYQAVCREEKGLEVLCQTLRYPPQFDRVQNSSPSSSLQSEFELQLLTLHVLRVLTNENVDNTKVMRDEGGFEKILDFVLWTAYVFAPDDTESASTEVTQSSSAHKSDSETILLQSANHPMKDFVQVQGKLADYSRQDRTVCQRASPPEITVARGSELKKLFDVLYRYCVLDVTEQPFKQELKQPVNLKILHLVLDLFNDRIRPDVNQTAREKFMTTSTVLQKHVLQFLITLLKEYPGAIKGCRKYGMWDALFSTYFCRWVHSPATDEDHGEEEAKPPESQPVEPELQLEAALEKGEKGSESRGETAETSQPAAADGEGEPSSSDVEAKNEAETGEAADEEDSSSIRPKEETNNTNEAEGANTGADVIAVQQEAADEASDENEAREEPAANSAPSDPTIESTSTAPAKPPPEISIGAHSLLNDILQFTIFVATVPQIDSNTEECRKLQGLLHYFALKGEPNLIKQIADTMLQIVEMRPIVTMDSLMELEAMTTVSDVISKTFSEVFEVEMPTIIPTVTVSKSEWNCATSLLQIVDVFLSTSQTCIFTAQDETTTKLLFELIFIPGTRAFALHHIVRMMKFLPSNKDVDPRLRNAEDLLFSRFMEMIPRISSQQRLTELSFALLLSVLKAIRDIVESNTKHRQKCFKNSGAFIQIASLLTVLEDETTLNTVEADAEAGPGLSYAGTDDDRQRLCQEVLTTLTDLLAGNHKSKEYFRTYIGYDQLEKLILVVQQGTPSPMTFDNLWDMLVDGRFVPHLRYSFANPHALPLILNLSLHCTEEYQVELLNLLTQLVKKSTLNRAQCCQVALIDYLLTVFPRLENSDIQVLVIRLIEVLATHSITVKELKKFFGLLKGSRHDFRPVLAPVLLEAMQNMTKKEGPSVFFYFDGRKSGLDLPTIPKWPKVGYTFYTWLCVESYEDPEQFVGYEPRLYSFMSKEGSGIEVFFDNSGHLNFVTKTRKTQKTISTEKALLKPGRWYSVGITHSNNYRFSGSSLKLFIDGTQKFSANLKYPVGVEDLSACHIATNGVNNSQRESPFWGQMGAIYLFNEALSATQLEQIWALGPTYMLTFQSSDSINTSDRPTSLFDGSLSSKILFMYNAKSTERKVVMDNCPVESVAGGTPLHAKRREGTHLCTTRNVRDIIHCLGGIKVLFPLFAQLDLPTATAEHVSADVGDIDYSVDPKQNLQVIRLLCDMLRESPTNRLFMKRCHGFSVISYLLQQVSPPHLTVDVVNALQRLVSVLTSGNLKKEAFKSLFLEPRIWIFTPVDVQLSLVGIIEQYFERDPSSSKSFIGVQSILDSVRSWYWETPEPDSLGKEPRRHPVTNEVIGQRPTEEEARQLRCRYFLLVKNMLLVGGDITLGDIRAILRYIEETQDNAQAADLLPYLVDLMDERPVVKKHLRSLGDIAPFFLLLQRDRESVRVGALMVLARLLDDKPPNEVHCIVQAITEKLVTFGFTRLTYQTLILMLLTKDKIPSTILTSELPLQRHSTIDTFIDVDETMVFTMPSMLPCIFKLLLGAEIPLRQAAVQDTVNLLSGSPSNCGIFVQQFGWQNWLLDLLADRSYQATPAASVVNEMIINMFKKLHLHAILELEGGWKHVENTVTFLALFAERGVLGAVHYTRTMLSDLLTSVAAQLCDDPTVPTNDKKDKKKKGKPVHFSHMSKILSTESPIPRNVGHLATLVEEFLFYSLEQTDGQVVETDDTSSTNTELNTTEVGPRHMDKPTSAFHSVSLMGRHMDASGGWEDRIIAQLMVDVLDRSLVMTDSWSPVDSLQKRAHVRDGGGRRISLRLLLLLLDNTDSDVNVRNLSRLEQVLFVQEQNTTQYPPSPSQFDTDDQTMIAGAVASAGGGSVGVVGRNSSSVVARSEDADRDSTSSSYTSLFLYALWGIFTKIKAEQVSVGSPLVQLLKTLVTRGKEIVEWSLACGEDEVDTTLGLAHRPEERKMTLASVLEDDDHEVVAFLDRSLFRTCDDPTEEGDMGRESSLSKASNFSLECVNQVLSEAVKSVESLEQSFLSMVMERREKGVEKIIKLLEDGIAVLWEYEKKLDADAQRDHQMHCYEEVNRRASASVGAEYAQVDAVRRWRQILRSLTNERGAWAEPETEAKRIFWKLDKTEDALRMRRKLKVNYDGSDHAEASAKTRGQFGNKQLESVAASSNPSESRKESVLNLKLAANLPKLELSTLTEEDIETKEEDAEWDLVGNIEESRPSLDVTERHVLSVDCELVTPMMVIKGTLELTSTQVHFQPDRERFQPSKQSEDEDTMMALKYNKDRSWPLDRVREIHLRRYRLRRSAIEIFLVDNTNFFVNFPEAKQNLKVFNKIASLKPPNLVYYNTRSPAEVLRRSGLTQRWQRREISNLEYLMQLNTIAGRTYNDLTQYPVFPWILKDYESDTLDIHDPESYRDLSKPIGALDPKRLEALVDRYECFDDPDIPKFHYGSHYSSAGITMFYLIRMEPFTTLAIQLQSGKFDYPDRLFWSVEDTWKGVLTNTSDVKELIPEFFYMPEIFKNHNQIDLGTKQNGLNVGDVILPPWASSPEHFVRMNRAALESDYVSENLHQWIDLIFGYKQRGEEAAKAYNVFYYLTYEGAVDLDKITDPQTRAATEAQIENFGQTPSQLLTKPHPKRLPVDESKLPFHYMYSLLCPSKPAMGSFIDIFSGLPFGDVAPCSLVALSVSSDKLVIIGRDRSLETVKWDSNDPIALRHEILQVSTRRQMNVNPPTKIRVPFAPDLQISPSYFQTTRDNRLLLSGGHWDDSFKCSWTSDGKVLQSVGQHKDGVTCVALGEDDRTLVTGSKDTTVTVWDFAMATASYLPSVATQPKPTVSEKPRHILYGHDDEVTCVAVSTQLDMIVSGSKDGTCIVHTVRTGKYVRSIQYGTPIHQVAISSNGDIVTYSLEDLTMYLHSINGNQIAAVDVFERLTAMRLTATGEFVVTGGEKGCVTVRRLHDLKKVADLPKPSSVGRFKHGSTSSSPTVTSLFLAGPHERFLFVGYGDGTLQLMGIK